MLPTEKILEHYLFVSEYFENVSEAEIYKLYSHSLITKGTPGAKLKVKPSSGTDVEPSWALGFPEYRNIAARILKAKIKKHNIKQIVVGGAKECAVSWALLEAEPSLNIAFLNPQEYEEADRNKKRQWRDTGLYGHLEKNIPIWYVGGNLGLGVEYTQQIFKLKSIYGFKVSGVLTLFASLDKIGVKSMKIAEYLGETSQENGVWNSDKFKYDYCIGTYPILDNDKATKTIQFWSSNNVAYE